MQTGSDYLPSLASVMDNRMTTNNVEQTLGKLLLLFGNSTIENWEDYLNKYFQVGEVEILPLQDEVKLNLVQIKSSYKKSFGAFKQGECVLFLLKVNQPFWDKVTLFENPLSYQKVFWSLISTLKFIFELPIKSPFNVQNWYSHALIFKELSFFSEKKSNVFLSLFNYKSRNFSCLSWYNKFGGVIKLLQKSWLSPTHKLNGEVLSHFRKHPIFFGNLVSRNWNSCVRVMLCDEY
ncbi:hypothetical protein EGR_07115 [Echinococcus granulosus]|uniref:Uncharacterized protein n=1 Tax=Echinococcus granulosus TaxID=6210 RepID=W6UWY9_ECHGR|nr:hypothetical protein EGR_07115 [Echinococcus granulosus]EUB58009.1 hypothetical protein EGR_07115 [Echinococcus granulosus]